MYKQTKSKFSRKINNLKNEKKKLRDRRVLCLEEDESGEYVSTQVETDRHCQTYLACDFT